MAKNGNALWPRQRAFAIITSVCPDLPSDSWASDSRASICLGCSSTSLWALLAHRSPSLPAFSPQASSSCMRSLDPPPVIHLPLLGSPTSSQASLHAVTPSPSRSAAPILWHRQPRSGWDVVGVNGAASTNGSSVTGVVHILCSLPCAALHRNSPKEDFLLPWLCTKPHIQREGYLFCCYLLPHVGLGLLRALKSGRSNNSVEIWGCCVHVLLVKGSISRGLSLFRGISQLMVSWMLWMFLPNQMMMRTTIHRCIISTCFPGFWCRSFPNQFEITRWCTTKPVYMFHKFHGGPASNVKCHLTFSKTKLDVT